MAERSLQEKLEERLEALKAEFQSGQTMLAELDTKQTNLRNTMLRISGAIQVLEEMLTESPSVNESETHATEANHVGLLTT